MSNLQTPYSKSYALDLLEQYIALYGSRYGSTSPIRALKIGVSAGDRKVVKQNLPIIARICEHMRNAELRDREQLLNKIYLQCEQM